MGARLALWRGDLDTLRRMRTAFEAINPGRRSEALKAPMDGGIALLEGRPAEARAHFAAAQHQLRELGLVLWLGMTDLDIVRSGAMELDERRRAGEEAREIFTRLRATALLDRLETAVAADETRRTPAAPAVRDEREIGQEV
jgi:hypothetical protein